MKVSDLINELQQYPPESVVYVYTAAENEVAPAAGIESLRFGEINPLLIHD